MKNKTTETLIIYEKNFLMQKTLLDNSTLFNIFDTSHSLFPEGDYLPMESVDKFKLLGSYSFKEDEGKKFERFLRSLVRKNVLPKNYNEENNQKISKFFVLGKTKDTKDTKDTEDTNLIKNPYDYQFLKLHLSYSNTIAQKKMEEFINKLKDGDFHKSHNKVYINNWIHIFLSIDKPYNLDGLKINEVEYDTSVFLNLNSSDKNVKNSWNAIKAGLMPVRH